jgi:hypothetical protein
MVQALVGQVETALAQWCMAESGIDLDGYIDKFNGFGRRIETVTESASGGWTETVRRSLFGKWYGNETAFFEKCADLVMERRDDLYEIACAQELRVAIVYERAVEKGLDDTQLAEIERFPNNPGEPIRVANLWYQLQLATKRLWELPFNETEVRLNESIEIAPNPRNDALSNIYRDKPYFLFVPPHNDADTALRLFLTESEVRALEVFGTPRIIGESVLEMEEMRALDDKREFLAICMRRGILVD